MTRTRSADQEGHTCHGNVNIVAEKSDITETHGTDKKSEYIQTGVALAMASQDKRIWTKRATIIFWIGLMTLAYVYTLEPSTTYLYLYTATSSYKNHSLLSTVQTASMIVISVGKPPLAKLADVVGRAESYCVCVLCYAIGYLTVAASNSLGSFCAGILVYSLGYTGLQVLNQVIIADISNLRWRGLASSIISIWFFVNAFVASNIAADVLKNWGWRWGYGMFAIIVPVAATPIISTLWWAQRQAIKLQRVHDLAADDSNDLSTVVSRGLSPRASHLTAPTRKTTSSIHRLVSLMDQLDIIGLALLTAGITLVLIPLTLARRGVSTDWDSAKFIAMFVFGGLSLILFVLWEKYYAHYPVMPFRFFRIRNVPLASLIGFFDFISFFLTSTYLHSFVKVTRDMNDRDIGYVMYAQLLALTGFGILAGMLMAYTRDFKWTLLGGLIVRLVAVGLMIPFRGPGTSTVEFVLIQVLQGAGGGFAAITLQVAAQGAVKHQDVAVVTALVLLLTELGGAIGTAVAGSVWANTMPANLEEQLGGLLNTTEIASIYSSIDAVMSYDITSPVRVAVIAAYADVMQILNIMATVTAVPPLFCALLLQNFVLTNAHNSVEDKDLREQTVQDAPEGYVIHPQTSESMDLKSPMATRSQPRRDGQSLV